MARSKADILQERLFSGGKMEHEHCEEIIRMVGLITGNGTRGIADKVDDHEQFIQKIRGAFVLLGFIGISNVIIIVKLFVK